jgi:hypothetical protein
VPTSRFLCEHLRQIDFIWACTSRIHAQVPVITTGKLTKTLHQQISCGIDVPIVAGAAFRARPLTLIEPQLIEGVLTYRASLARGIPAIHLNQHSAAPLALVRELSAQFAECGVLDRTGTSASHQSLHIQVFNTNQIKIAHQTRGEGVQRVLTRVPHACMRPRHTQPLSLTPRTGSAP